MRMCEWSSVVCSSDLVTVLFGVRWGFPLLVVTSLVFGLGHRSQDLPGAITAGISGVMFGLVYLSTGRKLLPAIATHMTSNFWGITGIHLYGAYAMPAIYANSILAAPPK